MARRRGFAFLSNPRLPLFAYAGVTVSGILFIVASKTYGIDRLVTTATPVLLMLAYGLLPMFVGRLRLHDEQTGDNLYYMGFLFTLTSLGVALFQFGSETSTDEIVRNFGVAITSTIAGIMLRILYNQMRRDPVDIERSARHELATMTRRVRAELESVSREFADFRRVSNQMLEEGFGEIAEQAGRNGEHIRASFEKMAMEAIKPVQEASGKLGNAMEENFGRIETQFSQIVKKVDSSAELLDRANGAMSASVLKLGQQADSVAGKLEKVVVPDEVLKNELAPMVKSLSDAVAQYAVKTEAASVEQQARISEITSVVREMVEKSDRTAAAAEKSAAAVEKSMEAAASQQRVMEAVVKLMQQQSQETKQLMTRLVDRSERGTALTSEAEKLIEDAAQEFVDQGTASVEPPPYPDLVRTLNGAPPAVEAEAPRRAWWSR